MTNSARGLYHNPMGSWDGMDILRHFWTPMPGTHAPYNGQITHTWTLLVFNTASQVACDHTQEDTDNNKHNTF